MASRDLLNNINVKVALAPVVVTDNTAQVTTILDTAGYDSATLVIITGTLADADATFAVLLEDGNDSAVADHAEVSASQQLGSETLAGFDFSADNACRKIGYHGGKRFLRATITPTNNSGNAPIGAVWVLGHPHHAPTSNPPA